MLYPLFDWAERLAVYGASPYIGPIVNLVHLLSMVTLMGAVLIVDLRLMGVGIRETSVRQLARDAQPWFFVGLAGIILSGLPQLAERATDQYVNSSFWLKMYTLLFALIWFFTIRRKVTQSDEVHGALPKVVGLVSMIAFLAVPMFGRLIMMLPDNYWFEIINPTNLTLLN